MADPMKLPPGAVMVSNGSQSSPSPVALPPGASLVSDTNLSTGMPPSAGPSIASVQAANASRPLWKKLLGLPADQQTAKAELDLGGGQQGFNDALKDTMSGQLGAFTGAAKGAAHTAAGIASLTPGLPKVRAAARRVASSPALTPNSDEKPGYAIEQTAEFLAPSGAVGKVAKGADMAIDGSKALSALPWLRGTAKLATRSALEGAATGAVGALQGQDPTDSALIGAASPIVGKGIEAASKLIPAGAIMNRLMRVAPKALRYGADPGGQLAKEGITGSSFGELDQKVGDALQQAGPPIAQVLSTPKAAAKTVDVTPAVKAVDDAMQKAIKFKNPELYDRLRNLRHELTFEYGNNPITGKLEPDFNSPVSPQMSPLDANELKQTVGDKINWATPVDRAEGQVRRQVYGILNNGVQQAVPEVAPLNTRYANLSVAKRAMERMADLEAAGQTPSITGDILKSVVRGGIGSIFNPELGGLVTAASVGEKALRHPAIGSSVASNVPFFLRQYATKGALAAKNVGLGVKSSQSR